MKISVMLNLATIAVACVTLTIIYRNSKSKKKGGGKK